MKKIDLHFIKECDSLIKLDKEKQVLETIQKIPAKFIPREYLSQIGTILNRVGGPHLCLKILHSYVRGDYFDLGSTAEKTEYAKALIEIGAHEEALELISNLPNKEKPGLLLTKAFCYLKSWNYEKALPLIVKYTNTEPAPYDLLIGKINLASVYMSLQKYDFALKLLLQLEKETHKQSKKFLKGYVLEQLGRVYFLTEKFEKAQENLSESTNILKKSGQKALFQPIKWQALLELKLNNNISPMNHFRKQNEYFHNYEALRDLDYWQALILKDKELMTSVFFGTPSTRYKARINQSLVKPVWSWKKNTTTQKTNILGIFGKSLPLPFELTSQLFCHLISDRYKPMTLGSIHSKLFAQEHFNPFSSPERIYQILSRLDKKLNQTFSYSIEKEKNMYIVRPKKIKIFEYYIKKQQAHILSRPETIFIDQIKELFQYNHFSVKELSLKYQVSSRTVNRWLQQLKKDEKIVKIGTGRQTKYKVAI